MNYLRILQLLLVLLLVGCRSVREVSETRPDKSISSGSSALRSGYPITDLVKLQPAIPVPVTPPRTMVTVLDSLMSDPLLEYAQAGIYVYDLTLGKAVFDYGSKLRLRPASTQKVLTAVTALTQLGIGHRYKTSLYTSGKQSGGTLRGAICVKGSFDPHLNQIDLRAFADALLNKKIRKVEGPLILDLSFKDTLEAGEGWCWDDENPSLSPLTVGGEDTFAAEFRKVLSQKGITVTGHDTCMVLPSDAVLLRTRSHSLDQVLLPMMKASDNQMAESMFYQLAGRSGKPWATAQDAVKVINGFIASKLHLDPTHYRVADGSGLSLYNYVTPELLVAFLRYAWENEAVRVSFLPSLPIAGIDGTLKKRMKETSAYGNVKAKTGTLTGVSSLAGYATAANGHQLCFAIIVHGQRKGSEARLFQDKICQIITAPFEAQ